MALKGSLEDFGLADILQLIHFQRKSGLVTIEGEDEDVKLVFFNGDIASAESKRSKENRLGKVLIKKGLIDDEDLKLALEEQRKSGERLGRILVRKGYVGKEEMQEILKNQIKETVVKLFGWKKGIYEFIPQTISLDKEIPISIDTQHILMEGLRILDEWSLIGGKLTLDTIFTRKERVTADLTNEQEEILALVDGENDLSTIVDISGKDDFLVAKTLLLLMEKGIVEAHEPAPVVERFPEKLKKHVMSFYFLSVLLISASILISLFPVFYKEDDTIKRFSASAAVEDLRYKIEAYRFEHGSYPDALKVISTTLDPWGNPYRYLRSDETFSILSKGPDGKEGTADDIY